ncbi:hypothetical protein CL617_00480 [archaeon]|nr:hypothetical protein [archaeon]|tara:strand:+ start:3998 stop:4465 length:468 start_codon:yes stop_codon:yes gene_type:complete
MRFMRNTFNHVIAHIILFLGLSLLHPVLASAVESSSAPWSGNGFYFWPAIFLVFISAYLIYRAKEKTAEFLQSFGMMVFLPGALALILNFYSADGFFSGVGITGGSVVQYFADWYISHSEGIATSVSAVYLFIGGFSFWMGHKLERMRDKLSPLK